MQEMIIIGITFGDKASAHTVLNELLTKRLIACANIFPIESMYWWKEEITEEQEFMAYCKTSPEKYDAVAKLVAKIHPYETPMIEAINIERINQDYLKWMRSELK